MALAARGVRDLGDGVTAVEDPEEDGRLRAQARGVYLRSFALTVVGTLVILLLPL